MPENKILAISGIEVKEFSTTKPATRLRISGLQTLSTATAPPRTQ